MKKDIVTIHDLSNKEIESIFEIADSFLEQMGDPERPYRIKGRNNDANQYMLATLFYEPSTRTRFSFESAMKRMGGEVLSSADPAMTSAAKGESLADTVRVVANYADLIVIRHSHEGAARVAADYSAVPVINAGDGSHEHPTQTLCDLYTLTKGRGGLAALRGLKVLLWGDLKNGRTVHSLVYALARFGACIIPFPAAGLGLPDHVTRRLKEEFSCYPVGKDDAKAHGGDFPVDLPIDVVYVTPEQPHQRALYENIKVEIGIDLGKKLAKGIDVCYVTRFQKERDSGQEHQHYPTVDAAFLKGRAYKHSQVLHPLPRVSELGYDLDEDPRGVYFKQAAYGVSVRMGLIAWVLGLKGEREAAEPPPSGFQSYHSDEGALCKNPRCVLSQEAEQRYLKPLFWLVRTEAPVTLRCAYCEQEAAVSCFGDRSTRQYSLNDAALRRIKPADRLFFRDAAEAEKAGFTEVVETPPEPKVVTRRPRRSEAR